MTFDRTRAASHDIRARIAGMPLENIAGIAKQAFDKDSPIIPLWFGEGDLPTPAFIGEAATRGIRAGHTFYSHQNGIPELRQTLSDYYGSLHGRPVGADRITVTSGGMPAIMLAIELLVDAGDNVVANTENVADTIEANASNTADAVRAAGENQAAAVDNAVENGTMNATTNAASNSSK